MISEFAFIRVQSRPLRIPASLVLIRAIRGFDSLKERCPRATHSGKQWSATRAQGCRLVYTVAHEYVPGLFENGASQRLGMPALQHRPAPRNAAGPLRERWIGIVRYCDGDHRYCRGRLRRWLSGGGRLAFYRVPGCATPAGTTSEGTDAAIVCRPVRNASQHRGIRSVSSAVT